MIRRLFFATDDPHFVIERDGYDSHDVLHLMLTKMHVKKNYCANIYSVKHITLGKKFTNKVRITTQFENV